MYPRSPGLLPGAVSVIASFGAVTDVVDASQIVSYAGLGLGPKEVLMVINAPKPGDNSAIKLEMDFSDSDMRCL